MSKERKRGLWWPVEIWLKRGNTKRRPLTRNAISIEAFEAQRRPNVEYVIYERMEATYSDGQGGRSVWRRAKFL